MRAGPPRRPLAPPLSAWDDTDFQKRLVSGLGAIAICAGVNLLFTPRFHWWLLVALGVGISLAKDYLDARDRVRSLGPEAAGAASQPEAAAAVAPASTATPAPTAATAADEHVEEARRLRAAVQDLLGRLTADERLILGDVQLPAASLETRVHALVAQGREVDAELALHDVGRLEAEAAAARERLAGLPADADAGRRLDEESALEVLEAQLGRLERVRTRRARIDARLRAAVGIMRALHLDLVELRSSDLDGSAAALARMGEQVRGVERGVDALASAVDEVAMDDLPRRPRTIGARRPEGVGGGRG